MVFPSPTSSAREHAWHVAVRDFGCDVELVRDQVDTAADEADDGGLAGLALPVNRLVAEENAADWSI